MFKKVLCFGVLLTSLVTGIFADSYDGMMEKAIQQAKEMGVKVSVAIVDQHGNLVAFRRMDGAILASIQFAQGKALTSAKIPASTADIAEMNAKTPGHPFSGTQGFVLLPGGVPIVSPSGENIGAIGVAGGSGEQDELCAKAAL